MENGTIEIFAEADVVNSGTIRTDGGDNLDGGSINIYAGNDIRLMDDSVISARGLGENSNGGTIVVFADNNARIEGNALIDARGGDVSGDGGFIEFSGRTSVDLNGGVLAVSAANGRNGFGLIDPRDFFNGKPVPSSQLQRLTDTSIAQHD